MVSVSITGFLTIPLHKNNQKQIHPRFEYACHVHPSEIKRSIPKELDGQANSYNAWAAYSDSKLANVIFAKASSAGEGLGKKEAN